MRRRTSLLLRLGAFVAVAALVAAMELGTLTGPHVGSTTTYQALFATPDGVSGLREGNAVRVSGVGVGKVTAIELVDAEHSKVTFTANHDQRITDHTYAVVRYANLLGQRFLALTQPKAGGAVWDPHRPIPATRTAPALSLTALFNGFRPLFSTLSPKQVNELSQDIVDVLQGQGDRIEDLFSRTASLTTNLADRDATLTKILDSMSTLLNTVVKQDDKLTQTLLSLRALTSALHEDGPAILGSLGAVDRLLGSVGGLFRKLQDHNLPGVVSDAATLTGTLAANTDTLQRLMTGFTAAFGTFDRITQNGNWLNIYFCNLDLTTYGTIQVTLSQIAGALSGVLGLGGLGDLVGGLLGGVGIGKINVPVPLKLPNGPIGASAQQTKVCS